MIRHIPEDWSGVLHSAAWPIPVSDAHPEQRAPAFRLRHERPQGRDASRTTEIFLPGRPDPLTDDDAIAICRERARTDAAMALVRAARKRSERRVTMYLIALAVVGVAIAGVSYVLIHYPRAREPLPMAVLAKADRLDVGGAR